MKKHLSLMPLILMFLISCSGLPEPKAPDTLGKTLEIALAFNTENYPWLLGTKYPQMAVWVEADGMAPETVFVTQGAGKDKWFFADTRPDALPVSGPENRGLRSMR